MRQAFFGDSAIMELCMLYAHVLLPLHLTAFLCFVGLFIGHPFTDMSSHRVSAYHNIIFPAKYFMQQGQCAIVSHEILTQYAINKAG